MVMRNPVYDVYLTPPEGYEGDLDADGMVHHRIEVRNQDVLRAELEGNRQGLPANPSDLPQNTVSLWAWSTLVRERLYDQPYQGFVQDDCYSIEPVRNEVGEVAGVPVDPTRPAAPSVSGSPSPDTTEAGPATGSTPSSTTD